jgi:hypothetical protein
MLSMFGLAASAKEKVGDCLVDSGEAVSDAMDASLFIWAASKRCGKSGETVKCEIDVTSAIKSVNSMANVVLKAIDKCSGLHAENKECGLTASKLSEDTAALAASAGEIAQKCPKEPAKHPVVLGPVASPVMCTIDLKNTAKSLFSGIKPLLKVQKQCKDMESTKCLTNILQIVAAFSGMGEYLAGAVGQCKRSAGKSHNARDALCAQAVTSLIQHASKVSERGLDMSKACKASPAPFVEQHVKLYTKEHQDAGTPMMSVANIALCAFLPLTAVVGFFGGRFYFNQQSRSQDSRILEQSRDTNGDTTGGLTARSRCEVEEE